MFRRLIAVHQVREEREADDSIPEKEKNMCKGPVVEDRIVHTNVRRPQ